MTAPALHVGVVSCHYFGGVRLRDHIFQTQAVHKLNRYFENFVSEFLHEIVGLTGNQPDHFLGRGGFIDVCHVYVPPDVSRPAKHTIPQRGLKAIGKSQRNFADKTGGLDKTPGIPAGGFASQQEPYICISGPPVSEGAGAWPGWEGHSFSSCAMRRARYPSARSPCFRYAALTALTTVSSG